MVIQGGCRVDGHSFGQLVDNRHGQSLRFVLWFCCVTSPACIETKKTKRFSDGGAGGTKNVLESHLSFPNSLPTSNKFISDVWQCRSGPKSVSMCSHAVLDFPGAATAHGYDKKPLKTI